MNSSPAKILVAEDNAALAGVLEFNLRKSGLDVTVARNGSRAIELINQETFDLILTDFQMPGANGEDVCRAARETPNHQLAPIIICSAKGFEVDTERLRNLYEVSEIATKPFSPREITQRVHALLSVSVPDCQEAGDR